MKTRFRAITWSAIDRITAILVPMDSNIHTLEDLGIELTSSPKAPKRLRRATAHHDVLLRFKVNEDRTYQTPDGTVYSLLHEELQREFTVMVFDMDTLLPEDTLMVDGQGVLKILGLLYGPEYHHVKQTVVLPSEGLAKGFGHHFDCFDQVEYDAVLYDIKRELTLKDGYAYIGSLGKLKETPAYMDIQSLGNMGFYEPHLAPAEGEFWLNEVHHVRFSEDEDAIRDLDAIFGRLADEKAEKKAESCFSDDEDDADGCQPVHQWAAVRAAKLMIESQVLPVLWRRGTQRAFENAVDILRGRIRMTRVARRLNICPNPLVFTSTGRPSKALDHLTHERFPHVPKDIPIVCCPESREGPMLNYRNPNTTKWEAILVWNVYLPALMRYRHLGFVFYGYDACTQLIRMNGADLDDSIIVISDPAYIAKWQSLEYPVTAKISATVKPGTVNTYAAKEDAKHNPPTALWNPHLGDLDVERWRTSLVGLGTVINRCALDTRLSGENQAYLIQQLEAGVFEAPSNFSCGDPAVFAENVALPFIKARPSFQLCRVAANSEYVIDWFQQHDGNEAIAKGLIKESEQVLTYRDVDGKLQPIPIFPKSWATAGKIPRKRLLAGDYLLVETKVCAGLAPLAIQLAEILEAGRQKEWKLVRPIPTEVDAKYPTTSFTGPAVDDLRKKWQAFRDAAQARGHKDWYHVAANGEDVRQTITPEDADYDPAKAGEPQSRPVHIEGLKEFYFYMQNSKGQVIPIPLHDRIGLAVEWFRQVYSVNTLEPRKNPDGTTQSVGDGVPDYILQDLLTAYEACGLTGLVVYVKLDPRAKRRLVASGEPTMVKTVAGQIHTWVIAVENGLKVGTISKLIMVPDGTYMMSAQGVIVVKESDSSLHSNFKVDQIAMRAAGIVDEVEEDFDDEDDDPYAV